MVQMKDDQKRLDIFAISNDSKDKTLKSLFVKADLDTKNREELRSYFERIYGKVLADAMVKDY